MKKQLQSGFKSFRYNSILVRNFFIMTAFEILLVCLLISLFSYQLRKNITDDIYHMNYKELERIADTLDTIITQIENFSYYLTIDNDMKLLVLNGGESSFGSKAEPIKEKIESFQKTFDYIKGVAAYIEGYDMWIENANSSEPENKDRWLPLYEKAQDQLFLLKTGVPKEGFPVILTFLHPIRNVRGEICGAVIVDIDLNMLNDSFGRGSEDDQSVYMIDEEGQILYANNIKEIKYAELRPELIIRYCESEESERDKLAGSEGVSILTTRSNIKGLSYVMYASDLSYQEMSDMVNWLLFMSLSAIICSIILSYFFARHSYQPIRHILNEAIEEGELQDSFIIGENVKDEIQFISECIRSAKRKNTQLTKEVEDWMKQLSNSQVIALQSQINPHFLYNTLDAINWLVLEKTNGEATAASNAISDLAQLLRISMSRSSYLVTLKEELSHAMLYVKLMNIRYAGRVHVVWDIPEELQEEKVIRLCLQPILENSITHGFGKKRGRGTIRVLADIVYDTLILRVIDDGEGLSEEACWQLNHELVTNYEIADKHVGIRNVNQRIRILFGERYGIQVAPGEKTGLMVTLGFPAIEVYKTKPANTDHL